MSTEVLVILGLAAIFVASLLVGGALCFLALQMHKTTRMLPYIMPAAPPQPHGQYRGVSVPEPYDEDDIPEDMKGDVTREQAREINAIAKTLERLGQEQGDPLEHEEAVREAEHMLEQTYSPMVS